MANRDFPHGFYLLTTDSHKAWYDKDGTSSNILLPGDPVVMETDGYVVRATAGDGNAILGVVMALRSAAGLPVNTLAAATAGSVLVCDDPNALYRIQCDDAGTAITNAARGCNAAIVYVAAGDATLGISGCEVDQSTIANTATEQVRIIELWNGPIGDTVNVWGDHCEVVVIINNHQSRSTTGV